MDAWIGMLLTVAGTALGTACLLRLRREACPACGLVGSLATSPDVVENLPAEQWVENRSQQCRGCRAVVQHHTGFVAERCRPLGLPRRAVAR